MHIVPTCKTNEQLTKYLYMHVGIIFDMPANINYVWTEYESLIIRKNCFRANKDVESVYFSPHCVRNEHTCDLNEWMKRRKGTSKNWTEYSCPRSAISSPFTKYCWFLQIQIFKLFVDNYKKLKSQFFLNNTADQTFPCFLVWRMPTVWNITGEKNKTLFIFTLFSHTHA